jgi:transcriptional/translational regulatory protein YebC/TACO1
VVSVIGDYTSFSSLCAAIETAGITPTKSGLQRLPTQPIELTDDQIEDVEVLLDKIEDDDDVQAVYTNLG